MDIIRTDWNWAYGLGYRSSTKYIVLHHAAAARASAADVHRWHLANGWAGIGYHFYVRKNGAVYAGRPVRAIGAHVLGFNAISIGVCAEGNYAYEDMPPAQEKSLMELVTYIQRKYGNRLAVVGHRDLNATACPGKHYPFKTISKGVTKVSKSNDLMKVSEYPLLKDQMLKYMLDAIDKDEGVSLVDALGFRVLPEKWGRAAQKLAWRISGRMDGVEQTARPTVELYEALKK